MSRLAHIATQLPEHALSADKVEEYVHKVAPVWGLKPETIIRVLRNSKVERRFVVQDVEQLVAEHTFKDRNDLFIEHSVRLGEQAIQKVLDAAGLTPKDVDMLFTVSCTGFMIPSMDAYLIPKMGMRPTTKRVPITELGCAAGAVGLSRAFEYIRAFPDHKVVLLAVELPSLTFQRHDGNMAMAVSSIIFGDGAAAALLTGEFPQRAGPRILATQSFIFPESLWYMGFEIDGDGLHIVLDKKVPSAIQQTIHPLVTEFLAGHGLRLGDIKWVAMHPAGKKPISFMEEELGMPRSMTQFTWDVLRDYGNMSSASVLFVLKSLLDAPEAPAKHGDLGLILAFGPGFSAELLLARWEAP